MFTVDRDDDRLHRRWSELVARSFERWSSDPVADLHVTQPGEPRDLTRDDGRPGDCAAGLEDTDRGDGLRPPPSRLDAVARTECPGEQPDVRGSVAGPIPLDLEHPAANRAVAVAGRGREELGDAGHQAVD